MKNVGILTLAMLIAMFGMAGTASAQCIDNLADGLGPASDTVEIGETIEYTISLSVPASPPPPSPPNCTLVNVDLYFFPPPLGSPEDHPCDADPGLGILIDSGLTLVPGAAPFVYTSADNAILSYVAQAGDAGQTVYAHIATYFNTEDNPTGPPLCDEKESAVDVGCPEPCVEITKTVDCEWSKVGDSVTYTICVENCGELFDLTNVVVTDDLLGGSLGFPGTLAPGETVCLDFLYEIQPGDDTGLPGATVVNTASVSAEQFCGDEITPVGDDSDPVVVTLLHPDYTVTKECQSYPAVPGGNADFLVTITNTGDVDLDIVTDDPAITPFTLMTSDPIFTQVVSVPVPSVDPPPEVCNTINVMGTIPVEYCNLPNELPRQATDCCPVEGPCIDITKEVDCDFSKVGDEVIYTICVTNCSDPPATLYEVVVTDPLLGGDLGFPTELGAGETVCMDFPYVIQPGDDTGGPGATLENTATVAAVSEAGTAVGDFAMESVTLLHPDFTVTKVCVDDPVPEGQGYGEFDITITNTGDVDLDITTDEPEIPGFTLRTTDPPYEHRVARDCVEAVASNTINVTATIADDVNECELTNVIEKSAGDECECPVLGEQGRWTGGGTISWDATIPEGAHVTHGFQFRCNMLPPNRLEVNWEGNRWHMMELLSITCLMNPDLPPPDPPVAPINEVYATGEGRYNNVRGYIADWYFTDVGEPGLNDFAHITITAPDGTVVLEVEGYLEFGNHQAHVHNLPGWMTDGEPEPIRGGDGDLGGLAPDGKESAEQLPTEAAVSQSSPNPFRDTARIQFQLPTSGAVAIDVYDVSGRHVVSLMDEEKPAGYHEAAWDGRNSAGSQVPAGVYFYNVRLGDETLMRKMILMR